MRLALTALVAALALVPGARADGGPPVRVELGRSALGRTIELYRHGEPTAPSRILVVGCIHGDE